MMIEVNNLTKSYGAKPVLDIVTLNIPEGETVGLVGNNGAGKTTLFNCMLDLVQPNSGQILIGGINVRKSEDWKSKVSAFLDETFLIGYLTPEEYFYFVGGLRELLKADVDEFIRRFEDFFGGEVLQSGKYIRDLSKGNQKKVGIAGAMIGSPKLVILDEPFANLDPTTQIKLKNLISAYSKDSSVTFLISSHDLAHTTEVCGRIVVLNKGEIVRDIQTNPETLKDLENYFSEE